MPGERGHDEDLWILPCRPAREMAQGAEGKLGGDFLLDRNRSTVDHHTRDVEGDVAVPSRRAREDLARARCGTAEMMSARGYEENIRGEPHRLRGKGHR